LESTDNYIARLNRAVHVDLCSPAISLFCSTVGQPSSVVPQIPDEYSFIWDDADLQGNSFLAFMKTARTAAAISGVSYILVDSVRTDEVIITAADERRLNIRPYLRLIRAEDLLNWRLDSNGQPVEVLFRVAVESPTSILDGVEDTDAHYEFRYWNRGVWRLYQEAGSSFALAAENTNKIKTIPLIPLFHEQLGTFRGESLLKSAAKYSVLLSNWLSNSDSVLEKQAFSQAVLKSASKPSEVGVGTDVVLHLNPAGKDEGEEDFFYAAPDTGPLTAAWEAFTRVFRMANKSLGLEADVEEKAAVPESGVARAWKFHEVERRLISMTENEQSAVRSVLNLVGNWKGQQEFPGSIQYSTKFELGDLEADIERTLALQSMGMPETARRELMRSCLKKALPALASDVQAQIDRELEHMGSLPDPRVAPQEP
jgi:hypothetical protein